VALKRAVWCQAMAAGRLLGAGVLGHSLGALTDGVLGQFSRQKQTDSGLDFSAGDGGPTVVVGQTGGLGSDPLEDVVDKRVHDAHGLAADASVGVNLLHHLVDVDGVALPPPPAALVLATTTCGLCLGGGLLRSLRCWFGSHDCKLTVLPNRPRILLYRASVLQKVSSRFAPPFRAWRTTRGGVSLGLRYSHAIQVRILLSFVLPTFILIASSSR